MNLPDQRLLKSVQQTDAERQRRLQAERKARILRVQNGKLREELKRFKDAVSPDSPLTLPRSPTQAP
jgi:hypothetical protein